MTILNKTFGVKNTIHHITTSIRILTKNFILILTQISFLIYLKITVRLN